MTLTMRIKPGREYLAILVDGVFDLDYANELTPRILDACALHRSSRLIVDARGVRGTILLGERYIYAETFARLYKERRVAGTVRHVQFAFVAVPPVLDPQRFGGKVAVSRGVQVKVFHAIEEACAWLEGRSPKPADTSPVLLLSRRSPLQD